MPADARRSLPNAVAPSVRGLLEVVRRPGAARLAAASFAARLPRGMAALAIVLRVRDSSGSYAAAGVAGAALAIGDALVSPLQGRLIDRVGPRRVLLPSAALYAAAFLALGLVSDRGAASVALAGAAGAAFPPVSGTMKALWPRVAGERLVHAGYALESLIQQSVFLLGPLLVAALVPIGSSRLAVFVTAGLCLAGVLVFAGSPHTRSWRPDRTHRGQASALRVAAVRALVAITLAQSVALGAWTVAVPAFAERHGHPGAAGLLLGALNVGALAGVSLGAAAGATSDPVRRHRLFSALLALGAAPVLVAASVAEAAPLLAVAGLFIGPTAAATYVLVDRFTPPGARTEAFTWISTAVAAGTALGSATAGAVVDATGVRAALALAFAGAAVAALGAGTRGRVRSARA